MTLGEGIKSLRNAKDCTQKQLARRLAHVRGISQSRLSQVEIGQGSLSAGQLEHIITALQANSLEAEALRTLAKQDAIKTAA